MPFEPGNKLAKGGRKSKPFTDALRIALSEPDPETQKTKLRLIADNLVTAALGNEAWAIKEVIDRVDGKAVQTIEATIDDKRDATDWTRDELVAFLNDAAPSGNGAVKANGSGREPDSVH